MIGLEAPMIHYFELCMCRSSQITQFFKHSCVEMTFLPNGHQQNLTHEVHSVLLTGEAI